MSTLKSEFINLVSASTTDFQPLDLRGARQVVISLDSAGANGKLTNEPFANSSGFVLSAGFQYPIVVNSSDDRLYFVSEAAADSTLEVWIIRG